MRSRLFSWAIIFCFIFSSIAFPQTSSDLFRTKRDENPQTWRQGGINFLARSKRMGLKRKKAKNIILFVGDGMGISTLTAARILQGQIRGESGEENNLFFENFPYLALSKTYSVNQQT